MRRSLPLWLVLGTALVVPHGAFAHGGVEHTAPTSGKRLSAAERHRASDLAGVSVTTLERRVRAMARKLGRRPGTATKAARARAAAVAADPAVSGSWSGVLPAPVVPVFEALLPNGKVLMWDSVGDAPTESYDDHTFTRAAIYDPVTNTSRRVDVAGANLFCAGFVQLSNGNVFVAGGNLDKNLAGLRRTHTFDWRTESWVRGPDMQDGRWYPSVAALPNDEALIIGGGPTVAEVRTTAGSLRRLTGVVTPSSRDYPFFQAAPDGRALLFGVAPAMGLIDTAGTGSLTPAGNRDAINRTYGSYAPYDVGRVLVTGGGEITEDGRSAVPTRTAVTIDTRSGAPVVSATSPMANRRRQGNLTTLADGSVLATGGQTTAGLVDLNNAVYAAERWDPATGAWTTLASAAVVREYHSTALLLPDGRVLTGGGGICSSCQRLGYLRRDQEIFSPPYLFRRDGSGQLATRPRLTQAPAAIGYDGSFTVTSPEAAQIRKVGLVRLGAPTHGEDQSQRYVPLAFTVSGTTLTVSRPNNPNEAPAGHYMLFAVDAAGVPSVAATVQVQRTVADPAPAATPTPTPTPTPSPTPTPPPTPTPSGNLARGKPATGSATCVPEETPDKAFNGSVSGGLADKFCSKTPYRFLQVDLGSPQTVGGFVLKHAAAGGEQVYMNTRDFKIETSLDGTTWSPAVAVTGNTASVTTHTTTQRQARYVRLVVTAGELNYAEGRARIYEFEVYAQLPAAVTRTANRMAARAMVAPGDVNLARGKPATGSATCVPEETPDKAFNGSVSGGLADKFCSRTPYRFLQVDLGSAQAVGGFVLKHAAAGGEQAYMNTRDFKIETSLDGTTWSPAVAVTGNTASVTTHTTTQRQARYVRLVVTAGELTYAEGRARIYEFEVYAAGSTTPPPPPPPPPPPASSVDAPLVAYSGTGATGRAQRFEVGQYEAGRGNLGHVGNDATRSIDIAAGYRATICKNGGLTDCTSLAAGRYATLPAGFDLAISSLRVVTG